MVKKQKNNNKGLRRPEYGEPLESEKVNLLCLSILCTDKVIHEVNNKGKGGLGIGTATDTETPECCSLTYLYTYLNVWMYCRRFFGR